MPGGMVHTIVGRLPTQLGLILGLGQRADEVKGRRWSLTGGVRRLAEKPTQP